MTWQRWLAYSAAVRSSWENELILGLGVWMIYLADRLADTAPHAFGEHETTRHAFYRCRHRIVWPVVIALLIGLMWLSPRLLPLRQFLAGVGLLAVAAGYFWLIHRRAHRVWPRFVPKEAVVGGMFAVGTGFFVLFGPRQLPVGLVAALPSFGMLCFFNCALIAKWERDPADVREPSSLLNTFPRLVAHLDGGCFLLALMTLAVMVVVPHDLVLAPITVSALLLAGLDRGRRLFSIDGLRVLADAVLLSPWLFLMKLH